VAIHDVAACFYRDQLGCGWVPGYLTRRGFGTEVLRRWQVGYAPASRDALVRRLRSAGYPDSLIETAGLARRTRTGLLADTFRDRAMLPIRDSRGRIVAFIGRAADHAGPAVPKYLNSPSTPLYRKGDVLFGLWEAGAALAAGAVPVIVEGPLDAIAIAIASERRYAPVALCGTVMTVRQVDVLDDACDLRATGALVAFDADGGGHRAAVRAYHLLSPVSGRVATVVVPAGCDPAQILTDHGPGVLAELLRQRIRPLADVVVDAEIGAWSDRLRFAEGQVGALRAGAAAIAAMPAYDVPRQVGRLAEMIAMDHATVTEAVTDALSGAFADNVVTARQAERKPNPWTSPTTMR
jgi:DNA primase